MSFRIVDGNDAFFGLLDALSQNNVSKILADPTLTTVSGRPAHFNVGGEIPVLIPGGFGQTAIEYKPFGTQVDFVPIVLGNGNIRLEVRPRVSEIDDSRSVVLDTFIIPALKVREVDTGVELKAGQTLALAGLIQTRVEAQSRSIPFLGDVPYVGAAFRSVQEEINEIELLIMVTPEFADGLAPHEVPACGPGHESVSPSHKQLYLAGTLEMPATPPCGPNSLGGCGWHNCAKCGYSNCRCGGANCGYGCNDCANDGGAVSGGMPVGGYGYAEDPAASEGSQGDLPATMPRVPAAPVGGSSFDPTTMTAPQTAPQAGYLHNPANRQYQSAYGNLPVGNTTTPGLIGPIGYDVD